jgi:hypothetical protein
VYTVSVLLAAVGLPIASIMTEWMIRPQADMIAITGKWFVFWGVGIRLVLAGISQAVRPSPR